MNRIALLSCCCLLAPDATDGAASAPQPVDNADTLLSLIQETQGNISRLASDLSALSGRVGPLETQTGTLGSNLSSLATALGARLDDLEKRCDGLNSSVSVLDARTSAPADVAGKIGGGPDGQTASEAAAATASAGAPGVSSPFLDLAHKALDAAADYVKEHVSSIGKGVEGEFEAILGRITGVQSRIAAVQEAAATAPPA